MGFAKSFFVKSEMQVQGDGSNSSNEVLQPMFLKSSNRTNADKRGALVKRRMLDERMPHNSESSIAAPE